MDINTVGIVTNHSISKLLKIFNLELSFPHHGLLSIYDAIIVSLPLKLNDKEFKKIDNLIETAKEHKTEVWFSGEKPKEYTQVIPESYVFVPVPISNVYDVKVCSLFSKEYVVFNLNEDEIPQYTLEQLKFTYVDVDKKCIMYLISGKHDYIYLKNNNGLFDYVVKKNKVDSTVVNNSNFENITLKPEESQLQILIRTTQLEPQLELEL